MVVGLVLSLLLPRPVATPTLSFPLPSPLPSTSQPVRGSGYCGHAHFSIMSSSACRKGSRCCNPTPQSAPLGTLVFPVPSIFSMKFLCLPFSKTSVERRSREECRGGKKLYYSQESIPFFAKCQGVERRSLEVGRG